MIIGIIYHICWWKKMEAYKKGEISLGGVLFWHCHLIAEIIRRLLDCTEFAW